MLYDTLTEFCTETSCPIMSAGSKYEYIWEDVQKIKKSIKCSPFISIFLFLNVYFYYLGSAPKHIDYILNWIQSQLDNEQIFPTIKGHSFHKDFLKIHSKLIFERLFRVFAHIYSEHFQQILQLNQVVVFLMLILKEWLKRQKLRKKKIQQLRKLLT